LAIDDKTLTQVLQSRVLRLNAVFQGVAAGILVGGAIFIATNWLLIKGGKVVGPHLALLGQFFPGYDISFPGSLIGFAYGYCCGFVGGYLIATLYNRLVNKGET